MRVCLPEFLWLTPCRSAQYGFSLDDNAEHFWICLPTMSVYVEVIQLFGLG